MPGVPFPLQLTESLYSITFPRPVFSVISGSEWAVSWLCEEFYSRLLWEWNGMVSSWSVGGGEWNRLQLDSLKGCFIAIYISYGDLSYDMRLNLFANCTQRADMAPLWGHAKGGETGLLCFVVDVCRAGLARREEYYLVSSDVEGDDDDEERWASRFSELVHVSCI